jgi:hypothetical protein
MIMRQGFPLRKSLFFGLTLVLISVLVYLVVQGYRMDKERLQQGAADVVETIKPTPIRALEPEDLEITAVSMSLDSNAANSQGTTTEHRIEIRNSGDISYYGIQLKLIYLDGSGAELGSQFQQVMEQIPPGLTVLSLKIPSSSIPQGAVDFRSTIVYADMESEE